jgi:hypothetical protein
MRRLPVLSTGSIRFHHISTENKLLIYANIFHNWHNLSIARLLLSCGSGIGTAVAGGHAFGSMYLEETGIRAQGSYGFKHTVPSKTRPAGAGAPDLIDRIEQ